MSTIKLELTVDANNIAIVTEFLGRIAVATVGGKNVNKIEVVDAEEVEAPQKAPAKPRPSRAKPKAPVVEDEDDEDLDGDDDIDLEEEDEAITADDLRAKQAEKVDKHRDAIKAQLKKLGATGIKDLSEKHYQAYFDFLSKLK